MDTEYKYALVEQTELDELLLGRELAGGTRWAQWSKPPKLKSGSVAVVWESRGQTARPLVLFVEGEDTRSLFGRYAHLRSDLSPLTTWCHVLTPRFCEPLEFPARSPDLQGLEAAWAGLIVAEAAALADMPLARIKISACLATHSFAIARTNALWHHLTVEEVTRRLGDANRLLRSESIAQRTGGRAGRIHNALEPAWGVMIALSQDRGSYRASELEPIVAALQALRSARSKDDPREAEQMARPLLQHAPEAEVFERLNELAPESRLRAFDKLVEGLESSEAARDKTRRNALSLLAGYLATVAAGGSPSLSLAEGHANRWPEITAWAYLTGGLAERVVWTSSFDGLGRLVVRELLRPWRLDEPPTCDFAFDEAAALVDTKLTDPLVHLKVKQARLLTLELIPGVNVAIPIGEAVTQNPPRAEATAAHRAPEASLQDPIGVLADAIWPYIRARIDAHLSGAQRRGDPSEYDDTQRSRGKRKPGQEQLPLNNPKRY